MMLIMFLRSHESMGKSCPHANLVLLFFMSKLGIEMEVDGSLRNEVNG